MVKTILDRNRPGVRRNCCSVAASCKCEPPNFHEATHRAQLWKDKHLGAASLPCTAALSLTSVSRVHIIARTPLRPATKALINYQALNSKSTTRETNRCCTLHLQLVGRPIAVLRIQRHSGSAAAIYQSHTASCATSTGALPPRRWSDLSRRRGSRCPGAPPAPRWPCGRRTRRSAPRPAR